MARQVFYDPYGMRQDGYDLGVQREMQLQDQTRRARVADWDYANMAPLRLQGAQRQERLGAYGEPYQRNAFGINQQAALGALHDAEQTRLGRYGEMRGDYSPAFADQDLYASGQYLNAPQYRPAYAQQLRQTADVSAGMLDPEMQASAAQLAQTFGVDPRAFLDLIQRMIGTPFTPQAEQGFDQYQTWDRARQYGLDRAGITQNRAAMEAAASNAGTNALNAQTLGYDRYTNRGPSNTAVSGYTGEEDGLDGDL